MEAIIKLGSRKTAGLAGSIISVALVFGGSAVFAEGLTAFSTDGQAPGLIGSFSDADLEQLEHATAAEATAARLATLGAAMPDVTPARSRAAAPSKASVAERDVFQHSGRLLPMLVTRPDAAVQVARAGVTLRPGLVQPVGVSAASLRSPTPAERAAH